MRAHVRVELRAHRTADTWWALLAVLLITGALAALWQPLGVIFLAVIGALWAFTAAVRRTERRIHR